MKSAPLFLMIPMMAFATLARADWTREELQLKTKSELIEIVLDLQQGGGGGGDSCQTIDPFSGERPAILTFRSHPGYSDHGTLTYPNGQVFMLRHSGYSDDYQLYFPNGQILQRRHSGYSDHLTAYWPNGQTQTLKHSGYSDDGQIYRADGSIWLRRHAGYSDDRQRYGLPVENFSADGVAVNARLTPADAAVSTLRLGGDNWTVQIILNGEDDSVVLKECFE